MNHFFTTPYDADEHGYFGAFGGRYVPEMLIPALVALTETYETAKTDPVFIQKYRELLNTFVGRPSPLTYAQRLTESLGGAQVYFKNEGCNLTGAHKINHCVGQALIAERMGKKILIAETGAGQHGVATATVAAKLGMQCRVFMGTIDMERQRPNVEIMRMLGATVVPVSDGDQTLKDAVNSALKEWIASSDHAHYVLGSCLGPHPYPSMNRDFQSIIGSEIYDTFQATHKKLPDIVIACVGGGSNAMGTFNRFLTEPSVRLIGVEAGGAGIKKRGKHATRMSSTHATTGIFHGYRSVFLQTKDGGIEHTHSISAGLDYPGVGPQLAYLHSIGRVEAASATDSAALSALHTLAHLEGIVPALESAHAAAHVIALAPTLSKKDTIVCTLSGRGDKDLHRLLPMTQ